MERLKYIVNKYNNKERICGDIDCNMMVLELYEPELYTKLHNRYKTIRGGLTLSKKELGYKSIQDFLEKSDNYIPILNSFARLGDIGVLDKHHTFIHLGNYVFGVQDTTFKTSNKNIITPEHKFYRRL